MYFLTFPLKAIKNEKVIPVRKKHLIFFPCANYYSMVNFVFFSGNGGVNSNTSHSLSAYSWVSSVSVCTNSDLAASGAGNGSVRLWATASDKKDIRPLYDLPLVCKIYVFVLCY